MKVRRETLSNVYSALGSVAGIRWLDCGEEGERARTWLRPFRIFGGRTLWHDRNGGNEERWSVSMKGHCFGLKCMNSCCYYARFFGFAGTRRGFRKACSHGRYISICRGAQEQRQKHSDGFEIVITVFVNRRIENRTRPGKSWSKTKQTGLGSNIYCWCVNTGIYLHPTLLFSLLLVTSCWLLRLLWRTWNFWRSAQIQHNTQTCSVKYKRAVYVTQKRPQM